MAKSITTWYCETCNGEFQSEQEADNCQHNHYQVLEILDVTYKKGKRCPVQIQVNVDIGDGDQKDVYYQVIEEGWGKR